MCRCGFIHRPLRTCVKVKIGCSRAAGRVVMTGAWVHSLLIVDSRVPTAICTPDYAFQLLIKPICIGRKPINP